MAAPIGREREFDRLLSAARDAAQGHGSIVLLAGATGSGKSFLLRELQGGLAGQNQEIVAVRCYEASAGNPLGPFGEALRTLTDRDRRGDRAKRVLELIGKVAPPLLELIPGIGKLVSLGVKAAADTGVYALGGDHDAQQAEIAADVAAALIAVAQEIPLVVVIDDAHWIDGPSTEVIARLADRIDSVMGLLVVAYDGDRVDDRHALARMRSALVGSPHVHRVALGPLDRDAIAAILAARYGQATDGRFANWLLERTEGSPLFLEQYLAMLEEQGVVRQEGDGWALHGTIEGEPGRWRLGGALAQARTPDTLRELLRPRVADLEDDDRSLLEMGSVQGSRFLSTVLVNQVEREENEILERLARLEARWRMVTMESGEDWWSDRSNLYAFHPGVLRELLYDRYERSPYERRRGHRVVAAALEALIAHDDPPPRHALLEIAHHHEHAGNLVAAARRFVEVADSTFAEGADRETAANAKRAVRLLRTALVRTLEVDARMEAHRLLSRAVVLLVLGDGGTSATEDGEPHWVELAEEGKRSAEAVGDASLRANAHYASARVRIIHVGLEEAIEDYRAALGLARQAGDALGEFAILVDLGHHLNSVNLTEGWAVLEEARGLLAGGALADRLDERAIARETASLETMLGVAALDLGRYGEAQELLVRSAEAHRATRRPNATGWALAFLGQLYTATGMHEAAESTLREGIALFADDPRPLALRGYLRALLGRVYLEWTPPRLGRARDELRAAREETATAGFRSVVPLVEAYYAEGLIAEGSSEALREADAVLAAAATSGWARSEITNASLRARVALAQGRVDDAVALSTEAVERLARAGGAVTAVRSEEILHIHAGVLAASGSPEAARYAQEAAALVREKAASIPDPARREWFLSHVRLSREILAG